MPTLSLVKSDVIKFAKWGAVILGIILALFLLLRIVLFVKEMIWPTPPTPPTVGFQKLPATFFPGGIKKDFTYKIDTVSGELPVLPDKVKVYKMQAPVRDLLAVDKVTSLLTTLGFEKKPEQLSDRVFRWINNNPPKKNLIFDVNNQELDLNSAFVTDSTVVSAVNFPNEKEAIAQAKSFLEELALYPDDVDETKTKTELLTVKNGVVSSASSLSNANLITVYFFQKDKDKLPFVYPQGIYSPMSVTIAAAETDQPQVIDARFFHQKSTNESQTYPIKASQQALDDLKAGKAYIATYTGGSNEIAIKKVYLAYYNEGDEQQYLMPVIVFEGSDNFLAFVPAVTDEWISK